MSREMEVLNSLVGEKVEVITLDRSESEAFGELLEISSLGTTIKQCSYGNEHIIFSPMSNIDRVVYKVPSV